MATQGGKRKSTVQDKGDPTVRPLRSVAKGRSSKATLSHPTTSQAATHKANSSTPSSRLDWLNWFLLCGVGLSLLGVTGASWVSSELTKTVILSWVVLTGLVAWLCILLSRGAVSWRWHWLDFAVLGWFVVNLLSALWSELPRVSVWGFGDLYGDGLVAVSASVLLFILIVNLPVRFSLKHWLWLLVTVSSVAAVGVFITAFAPYTVSFVSRLASQTGVVIALSLPLILSLRLGAKKAQERWLSLALLILNMTALILLDQASAWWVLLVGLAVWLLGQRLFGQTQLLNKTALVTALMVGVIFCLVYQVNIFQTDVFLSTTDTWQLIMQHLNTPGLGVGQQNFVLLSAAQNPTATAFVTIASSSVLAWLVSLGVVGVIAWLAVVSCLLWCVYQAWHKDTPSQEQWGAFAAWCSLVMAVFMLPVGLVSGVIFWILLATLHRSIWSPADWSIQSERLITGLSMLALAASSVLLLFSVWMGGRMLLAQYHFWTAQELYAQGGGEVSDEVKTELQAVHRLAPQEAEYNFALAELLLIQEEATPQGQIQPIQDLIQAGLRTAPYQVQWKSILEQLTQSTGE